MCVLIVEDEFLVRLMVQDALEDAGYEVMAAADGQEAFDQIGTDRRFSCLVTDYYLQSPIHGGHVIERMRPLYPDIPIILASANPVATSQQWRDHHKVEMLFKPYDTDELVELVRAAML